MIDDEYTEVEQLVMREVSKPVPSTRLGRGRLGVFVYLVLSVFVRDDQVTEARTAARGSG